MNRSLLIKISLIIGCVLLYFFLMRPIRKEINEHIYTPSLSLESGELNYSVEVKSTGSTLFDADEPEFSFSLYTLFGSFFLFGVIGFVALNASRKAYMFLVAWHIILAGPVILFTHLALHHNTQWIHAAIFSQDILMHWMTILAVPLIYMFNKGKLRSEK
ncbi:MAG: hypothetical protein WEA58_07190 [Balneolaceae bacterium]